MPGPDNNLQAFDGQMSFAGGMDIKLSMIEPDTYRFARNIEIRSGKAETRRGLRLAFPSNAGFVASGFYFNQDNERINDNTRDGFWFDDFQFVSEVVVGKRVQGGALVRSPEWTSHRYIICEGGVIRVVTDGISEAVEVAYALPDDRPVRFVQAANRVYLFIDHEHDPLVWDFSDAGFVPVPPPDLAIDPDRNQSGEPGELYWDAAPRGRNPIYAYGRLWCWINDDEIAASDILSFNNWDTSARVFAVKMGDGDVGTALVPYARNYILACKRRSISVLSGVQSASLEQDLQKYTLAENIGVVGPDAVIVDGATAYFMSRSGVYRIVINQFGNPQVEDAPISAPINGVLARINWKMESRICAAFYAGYLMFSVPLDGSTRNNAVLVFDAMLGTWVGIWDSPLLSPVAFFDERERLTCLNEDGRIRVMFCNQYIDSCNPFDEINEYNHDGSYDKGNIVVDRDSGYYYRCIKRNVVWDNGQELHIPPPNPEHWQAVEDPWDLVQIETELVTRFYNFGDDSGDIHYAQSEIVFGHIGPRLWISRIEQDPETEYPMFDAPFEYDYTKYSIIDKPDWNPDNSNLDFNEPDREDYATFIPATGTLYIGDGGIFLHLVEHHSARMWVCLSTHRGVSFRLKSERGFIRVNAIAIQGQPTRFANRER